MIDNWTLQRDGYLLGSGVLSWNRFERIGGRYGTVGLWSEAGPPLGSGAWDDWVKAGGPSEPLPLCYFFAGTVGRLVAKIVKLEPRHEPVRFWPRWRERLWQRLLVGPYKVGARIVLGHGVLFYMDDYPTLLPPGGPGRYVGLRPVRGAEGRTWLNFERLYLVDRCTVELRFVPDVHQPAAGQEALL